MKRCCKNIDITDRELIAEAVWDCLSGKLTRSDTLRMFREYTGLPYEFLEKVAKNEKYMLHRIVDTVIDGIRQEIIDRRYIIKKIRYTEKKDSCTGKIRKIGIQDIKQQIYDYIAVYAMKELFRKKIGYYQCGAMKGKGSDFGAKAIYRWLKDKRNRWAWQCDIRHYYENISKKKLKERLRRDVKNEEVLHLVFFLIDTFPDGLSIGSYLSQFLANYYLSSAYAYVSGLQKVRKKRDGTRKSVTLVSHVLFQMDDLLLISHSKSDLKMAIKKFRKVIEEEMGLEIKETARFIDLQQEYIDILGRKISRKNLTIRSSTFLKIRRAYRKAHRYVRKGEKIPYKLAKTCASRYGPLLHTDSRRFRRRYHVEKINRVASKVISREEKRRKEKEHAENEVFKATGKSGSIRTERRKKRHCNLPERKNGGGSKRRDRRKNHSIRVRREYLPHAQSNKRRSGS